MDKEMTLMDRIKQFYRPTGKKTDFILLACLITFIVVIAGAMLGNTFNIVSYLMPSGDSPAKDMFTMYMTTFAAWPVTLMFILIPPANRKIVKALTPELKGNTLKWILLGLLLGFGANALCVLFSLLFRDISLSFSDFNIGWFLLIFFAVFIQSGSEELICRVFMYQKLRRRYKSPWVAVIVNAVFFGALHMGNDGANFWGIAQCMIFGLLASVMVMKYNTVWGPIFMHTAWNFTQNILFGLPNSGVVPSYSVFHLDAASSGFFFDPGFGVEGSIGANVILVSIIIGLLYFAYKNHNQEQDLWKEDEDRILAERAQAEAQSETV